MDLNEYPTGRLNTNMQSTTEPMDVDNERPLNITETRHVELSGYFGFNSLDEITPYNGFKDQIHMESVIVVEAHTAQNLARINRGGPECWLAIPTHTHGYFLGALPQDSPHAKDVAFFITRQAREQAMHAVSGTTPTTYPASFAEWWIEQGGKFAMVDENVQLDIQGIFNVQAPTEHSTSMSNANENQVPTTSKRRRGSTSDNIAYFTSRKLPAGAFRIWTENGARNMGPAAVPNRVDHPVFSHCPPYLVDLRMLGFIFVVTHELLTWFPDHLCYCPDAVYRFDAAGWSVSNMMHFVHRVRGVAITSSMQGEIGKMLLREQCRLNHFRKQLGVTKVGPTAKQRDRQSVATSLYPDLSLGNWQPQPITERVFVGGLANMIDYYVSDLVDGVAIYPIAENAGLLTEIIRHLVSNLDGPECWSLNLSGVPAFARKKGLFRTPAEAGLIIVNQLDPVTGKSMHSDCVTATAAKVYLAAGFPQDARDNQAPDNTTQPAPAAQMSAEGLYPGQYIPARH